MAKFLETLYSVRQGIGYILPPYLEQCSFHQWTVQFQERVVDPPISQVAVRGADTILSKSRQLEPPFKMACFAVANRSPTRNL